MSCGEREKSANFDSMFDGSEFNLTPSSQGDCAAKLRLYNRWRRGEDNWLPDEGGPNPKELGLLIDYAADALEPKVCCGKFETCIDMCAVRADRFKSQRDELLAVLEKLTDVFANIGITSGLYDDEQDALKAACDVIASVKGEVMRDA